MICKASVSECGALVAIVVVGCRKGDVAMKRGGVKQ